MIFDKRLIKDFDKTIPVIVFILCAIGLFTLYSATKVRGLPFTESFVFKQINWIALGAILLIVVINISYQKFIDISYGLYAINIVLLVLVLIMGRERLGAQRWFTIGNFTLQPSEFIKINFILILANYLGSKKGKLETPAGFVIPMTLLAVPFLLVVIQPDLGTALLLVPIFLSMMFVAGARPKYLLTLIILGLASMPVFWHFLRDYQKQRLTVFLNPNVDPLGAGYTIIQSKIAVGSGGIIGKGWLAGTQNQLNFLPEHHTDFIFSVVGEEWGFIGSAVLLFLFYKLVEKGLRIAETTSDIYGKTLAYGIVTVFTMHIIVNIGMVCGLMPVVGIPLPLVSYGGSSLMMSIVSIGILENIKNKRKVF